MGWSECSHISSMFRRGKTYFSGNCTKAAQSKRNAFNVEKTVFSYCQKTDWSAHTSFIQRHTNIYLISALQKIYCGKRIEMMVGNGPRAMITLKTLGHTWAPNRLKDESPLHHWTTYGLEHPVPRELRKLGYLALVFRLWWG